MFTNYRNDVIIHPKTGSIYLFTATQSTIQKTDSTYLKWDVEPGSTIKLNGVDVSTTPKDSIETRPLKDSTYSMIATGAVTDTAVVNITVLPTGRIITFKANPPQIGTGENSILTWQVVKNSQVKLNGATVPVIDTMVVYPDAANNTYSLVTKGDETDSEAIQISISPPDQVDRAEGAAVTVSSNDTVAWPFSNPQNIVDGNHITRWQAAATPAGQSVELDLGRTYAINKFIIYWGNKQYAKQYDIQLSADDTNWTEIEYIIGGTGGTNYVETFNGLEDSARYVSIILKAQGPNGAYSIAEVEIYGSPLTAVQEAKSGLPTTYSLSQNYPNPFNPSTTINYQLPAASHVTLKVYDVLGREVETLMNQKQNAGYYTAKIDGSRFSSGVYFYKISILGSDGKNFVSIKKALLLK
jgi:hypothetical protein